MKCPNCLNEMQEIKKYDTDIDYCPTCKGVWLDKGEIDKIAKVQSDFEEEHYRKYHRDNENRGYSRYEDDDDDNYYGKRRKREGFLRDLFDFD